MFVGICVYQELDSSNKNPVAAFVSSLNGTDASNLNCTKWYSRCAFQTTDTVYCEKINYFLSGFYQKNLRKSYFSIFFYTLI